MNDDNRLNLWQGWENIRTIDDITIKIKKEEDDEGSVDHSEMMKKRRQKLLRRKKRQKKNEFLTVQQTRNDKPLITFSGNFLSFFFSRDNNIYLSV